MSFHMSFVVSISPEVTKAILINGTQLTFTCLKSRTEALEKGVKYVQN